MTIIQHPQCLRFFGSMVLMIYIPYVVNNSIKLNTHLVECTIFHYTLSYAVNWHKASTRLSLIVYNVCKLARYQGYHDIKGNKITGRHRG